MMLRLPFVTSMSSKRAIRKHTPKLVERFCVGLTQKKEVRMVAMACVKEGLHLLPFVVSLVELQQFRINGV
jgi:hypothetical protein